MRSSRLKLKKELAAQLGLQIESETYGSFVLSGFIQDRSVAMYYSDYRGIYHYDVFIVNPHRIQITFRSGILASILAKFLKPPASIINSKRFFEQFIVTGKSTNISSVFIEKEEIRHGLLKATQHTGGVKVHIHNDQITFKNKDPRIVTTIKTEIKHSQNVFDTLCMIAKIVDQKDSS